MANKPEGKKADSLVVEELEQLYEVAEQDIDSVYLAACTCTCDVPFVSSAEATVTADADARDSTATPRE